MRRSRTPRGSNLETTLVVSLVCSIGLLAATALGTTLVFADLQSGRGGSAFLAGWLSYQLLLLVLPIAGLVLMPKRRRLAFAVQMAWILAALPLAVFVVVSAVPPMA